MLTNFLVGIVGSLITLFLAPLIQNYFWHYQRRSEIQLRAIDQLNHFASEFMNSTIQIQNAPISAQLFQNLSVVDAQIMALFSDESYQRFKELEVMVGPNMGGHPVHEFVEARDRALRVLYDEVIRPKLFRQLTHFWSCKQAA